MKRLPVLGAAPEGPRAKSAVGSEPSPVPSSVLLAGGALAELVGRILATASAAGARLRVLVTEHAADEAQLAAWLRAGAQSVQRVGAAADPARAIEAGDALPGLLLVGAELGQRWRASLSVFVGRAPEARHAWDIVVVEPSDALGVALGAALASKVREFER